GAHTQLIVVWVEHFDAILRSLRERNAMPRIFVRAIGAGLRFARPSRNLEFGPARAQPFLGRSIFDGMHRRSSRHYIRVRAAPKSFVVFTIPLTELRTDGSCCSFMCISVEILTTSRNVFGELDTVAD